MIATPSAEARVGEQDTTPFSPYVFRDQYLAARSQPASLSTNSTLMGIQQTFARESFLDEVARESDQDPIVLRLRHLDDARGIELIESVAKQADWQRAANPSADALPQDLLRGRGFAYSQLPDRNQRMESGVRSAWIADVEVNLVTGDVQLTRLVVGQDAGPDVDTDRLQQTLQARVLGEARPLLGKRPVSTSGVTAVVR